MKKVLISLLSIIFIISMITTVNAATGTVKAEASANTVIKGKTFTVTLTATAENPIDGMYTKFNYDKSVLELVSATAGEKYGNNSSDGEILVTSNSSETSPTSGKLYTITFKVLENTEAETATISFSESELHLNVEGTVSSAATTISSVTINVKKDETTAGNQGTQTPDEPKDEQKPEDTNTPSNGDTNDDNGNTSNSGNTSNKKNTTTKKNTTVKKNTTTKLPQTGAESASVIAIIALGAVAIASYISYRRYKNI